MSIADFLAMWWKINIKALIHLATYRIDWRVFWELCVEEVFVLKCFPSFQLLSMSPYQIRHCPRPCFWGSRSAIWRQRLVDCLYSDSIRHDTIYIYRRLSSLCNTWLYVQRLCCVTGHRPSPDKRSLLALLYPHQPRLQSLLSNNQ